MQLDLLLKPLIRYAAVGVACNLIGYLAYLLLTFLGVEFKVAMSSLYLLGTFLGYLGNRHWTFEHKGKMAKSMFRYCLAHFSGYLLNLMLLMFFVDKMGYPHEWVQAAAVFVVGAFLFVTFKMFVFRNGQPYGDKA